MEAPTDVAKCVYMTTLGASMQLPSPRAHAPSDVRGRLWAPMRRSSVVMRAEGDTYPAELESK